jgi:hypothetical protein
MRFSCSSRFALRLIFASLERRPLLLGGFDFDE